MTFVMHHLESDRNGAYRHRLAQIGLARGEQGIPDGFVLTAVCGATHESATIDLKSATVVESCEECERMAGAAS